jgi:hypothetical protein
MMFNNSVDIGRKILSVEELPQGALARYRRDICSITGKEITDEEWAERDAKYEKERLENPQVYNWEIEINKYASVSIWRRKNDAEPTAYISDMAPNGGAGVSNLDGLISYAQMYKREDLIPSIKDAYEKAMK